MEEKIDILIKELRENTEYNKKLLALLEVNNKHTKDIHDYIEVQLTPEQELKDFGLNTAANLLASMIKTPIIMNTTSIFPGIK